MATQAEGIADLLATTQRELGKNKWTNVAADLQQYVAMSRLLKKESVGFSSGTSIQWDVQKTTMGRARRTGLYSTDGINVTNVMTQANVPWRHYETDYAFDRREMKMNRAPARIVDLVKVRRNASMLDLAVLMETDFWGKPDDDTDTDRTFGVAYWITNATSTTGGFNGSNPTGFTSGKGGISSSVVANWQNWCAKYTAISQDDFIYKLDEAILSTNFMSPFAHPDHNTGDRYGFYCNHATMLTLLKIVRQQNSNLGTSVDAFSGQVRIGGQPLQHVPFLNDNTYATDPLYGINWGVFKPVFLTGEYLVEDGPRQTGASHMMFATYVNLTMNFICRNPRLCFVLNK